MSMGAIFPTAFAPLESLCHIMEFLQYFELFHFYYICLYDKSLWSVIFEVTNMTHGGLR